MDFLEREIAGEAREVPPPPPLRLFMVTLGAGGTTMVEAHAVAENHGVLVFTIYIRDADNMGYTGSFPYLFKEWKQCEEVKVAPGSKAAN